MVSPTTGMAWHLPLINSERTHRALTDTQRPLPPSYPWGGTGYVIHICSAHVRPTGWSSCHFLPLSRCMVHYEQTSLDHQTPNQVCGFSPLSLILSLMQIAAHDHKPWLPSHALLSSCCWNGRGGLHPSIQSATVRCRTPHGLCIATAYSEHRRPLPPAHRPLLVGPEIFRPRLP